MILGVRWFPQRDVLKSLSVRIKTWFPRIYRVACGASERYLYFLRIRIFLFIKRFPLNFALQTLRRAVDWELRSWRSGVKKKGGKTCDRRDMQRAKKKASRVQKERKKKRENRSGLCYTANGEIPKRSELHIESSCVYSFHRSSILRLQFPAVTLFNFISNDISSSRFRAMIENFTYRRDAS